MTRAGLLLCVLLAAGSAGPQAGADDTFFRDRVAPILKARCVSCHGGRAPKGKLSLATAEGLNKGGDNGPAIEPGQPDQSLLISMVTGDPPDMPRKGPPLTGAQVETLKRWVANGARWPAGVVIQPDEEAWWSLQPLRRPPEPPVDAGHRGWVRTPVDAFILRELLSKQLAPAPEADRRTLIRRLTFDLHGLPPSPEEIDAFLADPAPDAYERLVDRLLASPRYGERWGRHWLDVVHYGDTHGYDKDKRRDHAWPYRDYVISAFNADKPYARFVQEQVAGDVLWPDDPDATMATGFLAAGPWDFVGHVELREGTAEKQKTRLLDRDDMVSNTMSTFTSLTVHCARCHDHKFDPIPQAEYYRLQAVFAGIDRGDRPVEHPETRRRRQDLEARGRELTSGRDALMQAVLENSEGELAGLDEEREGLKLTLARHEPTAVAGGSRTNGYHSAVAGAPQTTKWVQLDLGEPVPIELIRLVPARPTDFPDTPGFGFPLRFRVEAADNERLEHPTVVVDQTGTDFGNPGDGPVEFPLAVPLRARFVRVTAQRLWMRTDDFVFALAELEILSGGQNRALGAAVSALDSIEGGRWSKAALVDGRDSRQPRPGTSGDRTREPERVQAWRARLASIEARRAAFIEAKLGADGRAKRDRLDQEIEELERAVQALPRPQQVYAVVPHAPRPIHVLARGDVEQPGARAIPGSLSCVAGLSSEFTLDGSAPEGQRRAALARWLVDPANGLTWRSIVNRVWQYHFGRGLVDTPNDFGRNGGRPSHPELLDWLACELRDGGQSLKALHRLIVCSSVYRQAARHNADFARMDAENRLLWRMNRQRLDAESIRDAVLAVSGQLDLRMGGPGFELFRFKDDHSPVYDHDDPAKVLDPATYRRTVYRFTVRSVPNPFLDCLDGADPNASTPVRNVTITALQALALLNDRFMVAQSEAFARRLEREGPNLERQVDSAYLLALGRHPTSAERSSLSAYVEKRGLARACLILLNANEFVFVD